MYDAARLVELQRRTFDYFLHERDPATGLVKDNTRPDAPASRMPTRRKVDTRRA
jgi:hypothetical protein